MCYGENRRHETAEERNSMKITYTRKGDYLFPELELRETETRYIGKYGILRKTYLKEIECYLF